MHFSKCWQNLLTASSRLQSAKDMCRKKLLVRESNCNTQSRVQSVALLTRTRNWVLGLLAWNTTIDIRVVSRRWCCLGITCIFLCVARGRICSRLSFVRVHSIAVLISWATRSSDGGNLFRRVIIQSLSHGMYSCDDLDVVRSKRAKFIVIVKIKLRKLQIFPVLPVDKTGTNLALHVFPPLLSSSLPSKRNRKLNESLTLCSSEVMIDISW